MLQCYRRPDQDRLRKALEDRRRQGSRPFGRTLAANITLLRSRKSDGRFRILNPRPPAVCQHSSDRNCRKLTGNGQGADCANLENRDVSTSSQVDDIGRQRVTPVRAGGSPP